MAVNQFSMGQSDCPVQPPRESRHIQLNAAINRIEFVLHGLVALRARIGGTPFGEGKNIAPAPPAPPLVDVLTMGSDRIQKMCAEMESVSKEIEEMLF